MGSKLSGAVGMQGGVSIPQNSDINVTPFVDIMLVLLIIFMVSAPLATVAINLDLPPADYSQHPTKPPEPLYISVQESGAVFIGEKATSLQTLAADACAGLGGGDCRDERIFVRAEPGVRYDQFMGVMNTLQSNGFFKVSLLNEDIT